MIIENLCTEMGDLRRSRVWVPVEVKILYPAKVKFFIVDIRHHLMYHATPLLVQARMSSEFYQDRLQRLEARRRVSCETDGRR